MQSLSKLIVAFFLSVVFLLNTAVAYAIPQNIDSIYDYDDAAVMRAVILTHETDPDSLKIIIDPSLKGTVACTQTVVLAPGAPICAAVGAIVGGVTGFVFGSSG